MQPNPLFQQSYAFTSVPRSRPAGATGKVAHASAGFGIIRRPCYYAEHGCLPEGTHHVLVTIEPEHVDEGADIKNLWNSRSPRYLKTDITFPPAAAYQTGREPPGSVKA